MATAMEMMAKAALDQFMRNIPPDVLAQVQQIGQFVGSLNARLDRIENSQRLIMDALKIGTEGQDHAERQRSSGNGPVVS